MCSSDLIKWPAEFAWFFNDVAAPVQLVKIEAIPGFACLIGDMPFNEKYKMVVLVPLALGLVLSVPSLVCGSLGLLLHGGWTRHERYKAVTTRRTVWVLFILFLIYPALSSAVFEGLHCKDYGLDGMFLLHDHRVDCSPESPEYQETQTWAIFAVFIYPIGIPLGMLYTMYMYEVPKLAQRKRAAVRFNSLLHLRKSQVSNMANSICANAIGYCTRHETNTAGLASGADSEFQRRVDYLLEGKNGLHALFRRHHEHGGSGSGRGEGGGAGCLPGLQPLRLLEHMSWSPGQRPSPPLGGRHTPLDFLTQRNSSSASAPL